MNRSRVVIFLSRSVRTGGQRYLVEVLSYLQGHSVQVTPIYLDDFPKRYRKLGLVLDCLICNLWLFKRVREIDDLSEVIFFEDIYYRPRLLLFNTLVRFFTGKLKTIVLVQNVLTNHRLLQSHILCSLDSLMARLFFWQATLVFANSEFIRQESLSRGVAAAKTKVIYCGYESLRDTSVEAIEIPQHDDSTQRILFVGQCEPYKGVDILLNAIGLLGQGEKHPYIVDIVGDTTTNTVYYRQLLEIVERDGLQERVNFHGHVSDKSQLQEFYESADVFVLPSRYEGFGIVLLEAMSFGLPIVATTAGAIPELVGDGLHGLLVPPDDPQALAEAIARLLRAPDLRAEFGRNGYIFAWDKREFFSWDAVGERVLRAMEQLTRSGS